MVRNAVIESISDDLDQFPEWITREGLGLFVIAIVLAGYWIITTGESGDIIQALRVIAPILGGLGTLVLAGLYWRQQRIIEKQAQIQGQQTEIMSLQYLPKISIDHEPESAQEARKPGWLTFENIGEVPIKGHISLALMRHRMASSESPLLDPDISYQNLPDEVKVFHGHAGDWRRFEMFLEPGEVSKYDIRLISREIDGREMDHYDDEFLWFRVDGRFQSTIGEIEPRQIQRLFHVSIDENTITFTSQSFEGARVRSES